MKTKRSHFFSVLILGSGRTVDDKRDHPGLLVFIKSKDPRPGDESEEKSEAQGYSKQMEEIQD